MIDRAKEQSEQDLIAAYKRFDITLRVRQSKLCFWMAICLVPLCIGLDYWIYPDLWRPIFNMRLLCDAAMVPGLAALYTAWGKRWIRILDTLPLVFCAGTICGMIYMLEGAGSPYYAGLNIVMAAAILLVPYTTAEAVGICLFVITSYAVACLLHHIHPPMTPVHNPLGGSDIRTLINNVYFLGMTAMIAVASSHYAVKRRFQEFRLRHELDVNNTQLIATVKKLKETEVQLVQSEKLNALGKLSAGLLHEVNNPLNFTFMALKCANNEAGDNAELKETLGDIEQGMTRIRGVIADLRAFAYPSSSTDSTEFSLEEAFDTAARLTAQETSDIKIDKSQLHGTACGAKTQIVHVFMNLLVNSAHALKKKPTGRPPIITVSNAVENARMIVSVHDNGVGIAPENQPRIFEPFFTTKASGEGTGLGLSICHTIISNHGGKIGVTSELGQWTKLSFDLGLPSAQIEKAQPQQTDSIPVEAKAA
jgi:two-component system sensor histidine kinase PhcS